jgi:hypothetical protein
VSILILMEGHASCVLGAGCCTAGTDHLSTAGRPNSVDLVAQQARVRSMLLCGADMVESLTVPGVWRPEHVRHILQDHGLVCIGRCVFSHVVAARELPTSTSDISNLFALCQRTWQS